MNTISAQHTSEAEAQTALVHLLLTAPGETRAERAFLVDGRLYKLSIEQVKDGTEMQSLINKEAGLPPLKDDPYAIDPADMLDALKAVMADPDLGANLALCLALLAESNGDPGRVADTVDSLRSLMRWHEEREANDG